MVTLGQPRRLKLPFSWSFLRRGRPVLIPKPHQPLWAEKGWHSSADGKEYSGYYTASGRRWRGLIRQPYAGRYDAYIWSPPLDELARYTSHRPCFSTNGEAGRHSVHFTKIPDSLDHAITNIETILTQAVTGRRS